MSADAAEWVLGEDGGECHLLQDVGVRWMELPHAPGRQRGHILLPDEYVASSQVRIDIDHVVCVEALRGVPRISDDGLLLRLRLRTAAGAIELATMSLTNGVERDVASHLQVGLAPYAGLEGALELACDAGPGNDPRSDWAAVSTFLLARGDRLGAARARSQSAWRLANEAAHFTSTYARPLYDPVDGGAGDADPPSRLDSGAGRALRLARSVEQIRASLASLEPAPGDFPQRYAQSLLIGAAGGVPNIDFAARLKALHVARGRLRVLSAYAGAARVEEGLLRNAGVPVDLVLVDINAHLLEQARARMPSTATVHVVDAPLLEAVRGLDEPFDIVMFVSGAHHVPDLETCFRNLRGILADDGEFWLIGESIGRNGNRLWPEVRGHAEALFAALPERLRLNANTNAVDALLPDIDCSTSSFEGVRSEEIVGVLRRHFVPVTEYERNCMLWRFVDLAYQENYDLTREEDRDTLRRLAAQDHVLFASGARGCELDGVYRPKAH